jgi:hypothetical protein
MSFMVFVTSTVKNSVTCGAVNALLTIAAAVGPAAAQDLRRTDERHLQRQFDPVGPQMLETARTPEVARPRPVLLRSPKSLAELGKYDAKASAACRARDGPIPPICT